jgi:hypothetical protein
MGRNINQLLTIAGPALSSDAATGADALDAAGVRSRELLDLLRERNGFYAFEGALHVLPAAKSPSPQNLVEWNSFDLWRGPYGDSAEGLIFWAEDAFGCQFALNDDGVYRFDPETGGRERVADTLEDWAGKLLSDYSVETGYSVAHEWQLKHGELPIGSRLVPKQFFILGGSFDVDNLYALDAVKGMDD